jgi:hypothetical protein
MSYSNNQNLYIRCKASINKLRSAGFEIDCHSYRKYNGTNTVSTGIATKRHMYAIDVISSKMLTKNYGQESQKPDPYGNGTNIVRLYFELISE